MSGLHDFDWFAERVEVARWNSTVPGKRDVHAACPVHGGSDSLHIEEKNGKALVHCFAAECRYADVVEALSDAPEATQPPDTAATVTTRRVVAREAFKVREADGTLVGIHERRDYEDGTKSFAWRWPGGKRSMADVPLYGSEEVASFDRSKAVILTEGERKRDRLTAAGYQAVALTYSKPTPSAEVLSVLDGLDVILWPDNDAVGRTAMDNVARAISGRARSVSVVRWADAPPKGDAADFLDAHTVDECDDLLSAAEPFEGDPAGWGGDAMDVLDLLETDHPALAFVVPGVLPEGTAILASNPKIGKSAMIYQLSAELSLGGVFLDSELDQRPVLYLALEDGERRSKERAAAALAGRRPRRGMFSFRWAAPKLGEGLEGEVEAWLDAHPRGVVFIDTFQKVRSVARGNANAYQVDVSEFTVLQDIVRRRPGATLVLVLHLRKARDDDFLARVSGTLGITGSADTTLVIERERHQEAATLHVTGRDVGEHEVPMRFDGLRWSRDDERIPKASPERQQVYDLIREMGPVWPKDIAEEINGRGGDQTRTGAQGLVKKLVEDGWVRWTPQGYEAVLPKVRRVKHRGANRSLRSDRGDSGDSTFYSGDSTGDSAVTQGHVESPESPESPQSPESSESPKRRRSETGR